jgi:hypothetical protein
MNDSAKEQLQKLETGRISAIILLFMSVLLCIGGAVAYWYVGTADMVLAIPIGGSLVVSVMAYNKNDRLLKEFRARYPDA